MNDLLFYIFSFFSIVFALCIVVSKNPVHSILSLILVFFNVAGFFIVLGVEFLGILFIIVYVGAVAVLFLFVIMMLNIKLINFGISMYRYIPILLIFGVIFFFEFFFVFFFDLIHVNDQSLFLLISEQNYLYTNFINNWLMLSFSFNNLDVLSNVIYTFFAYLFFISGLILLVSMLGAISLTLHKRNDVKKQQIYKQIQTNFSDSIIWRS